MSRNPSFCSTSLPQAGVLLPGSRAYSEVSRIGPGKCYDASPLGSSKKCISSGVSVTDWILPLRCGELWRVGTASDRWAHDRQVFPEPRCWKEAANRRSLCVSDLHGNHHKAVIGPGTDAPCHACRCLGLFLPSITRNKTSVWLWVPLKRDHP